MSAEENKSTDDQTETEKSLEKKEAAKRISIGSQRDVANPELYVRPAVVAKAQENPLPMAVETIEQKPEPQKPQIRSTLGLGDNLDAEIEAALEGTSMDDLINQSEVTADGELEPHSRVKAVVSRVAGENVFCTLKGRFEGVIGMRNFKEPPNIGDLVEVIIKSQNEDDGLWDLSLPGASVDSGDWESLQQGDVVDARVTGANTGGLEVLVNNLRGFIPASQISRARVETFGDYVNQKLQCVVQEINPQRKKLVLSRRAILDREFEEKRKEAIGKIEVGQTYEGLVTRLMDFGAFVDIGGVEGLIHISKLSWSRVKHPSEVLEVGQKVKVKIEKANLETGKFSLSHRDTMEHPWNDIEIRFPVNSVVKGTVTRLAQFGAFVQLDPGIEGLIHISELAHHRVYAVKNIVKEGDIVEVKILSVDRESQKIGLSLKATQAPPERKSDAKPVEEEVEQPRRPLVVTRTSNEPLRGGTGRPSGGDKFGLNL